MQASRRIVTSSGIPYGGLRAVMPERKPVPIEHIRLAPVDTSHLTGRKHVCRKCREIKHVYSGSVIAWRGTCYDCPSEPPPKRQSRLILRLA
jgi:hypothetical protein